MPIQRQINIKKSGGGITFSPNPLDANTQDQIFWTNNDDKPHWPGRVKADGTIDKTFFMDNQIAPNGDTSPIFAPSVPGTLNYKCTVQGHENETGSITVT